MPDGVEVGPDDWARARRDEQVRLWWGRTPVDLFFRASSFHDGVADRMCWHPFASASLPFLSADDLAVFKALYNRPKDWLDIEAMIAAGSVDVPRAIDVLHELIGDDERIERLSALRAD